MSNELDVFNNNFDINLETLNKYIEDEEHKIKEQNDQLKRKLGYMSQANFYNQVLTCRGIDKCPYGVQCPFYGLKTKEPVGQKCPYEMALANKFASAYMSSLDIQNMKHHEIIQMVELIETDLLLNRQQSELSNSGLLTTVVKKDSDGNTKYEKVENPLLNVIDKLHTRKEKLFKNFNATRSTYKNEDMSNVLKEKLANINKEN